MNDDEKRRAQAGDKSIRAIVFCPWCRRQHVDRGIWATRVHRTHLCEHCDEEFDVSHPTVFGAEEKTPEYLELSMKESFLRKAAVAAVRYLENHAPGVLFDADGRTPLEEYDDFALKRVLDEALSADPGLIPGGVHGNGCAKCGQVTFGRLCAKCKG